jgi:hypothetical protein
VWAENIFRFFVDFLGMFAKVAPVASKQLQPTNQTKP